jgi:hypothetical protein
MHGPELRCVPRTRRQQACERVGDHRQSRSYRPFARSPVRAADDDLASFLETVAAIGLAAQSYGVGARLFLIPSGADATEDGHALCARSAAVAVPPALWAAAAALGGDSTLRKPCPGDSSAQRGRDTAFSKIHTP